MILANDHIRLESADEALAEALADYYRRNRDFLREFEPTREEAFFTAEHQREILRRETAQWEAKTAFRFYIRPQDDPERIIGLIGLSNVVWGAFCSAFLGYKLDKDWVRRGYMSEAVELLVDYAFGTLGLHRIEGNIMPKNRASQRVLQKCGFTVEGLAKHYLKINGVWEDHIHFVRLNYAMHESEGR